MAILTLDRFELEKIIGKITKEIEERITMFGTTVERISDDEIAVEIYPNRPDLMSLQGFARAILAFLEKKPGLKKYNVEPPQKDYKVTIDKSVKKVRPFTACAIVKNLKFDEEKINEIIDIQEKLHVGYGRNRKKLAIGVYPLEQIKLPIRYMAKRPEEIKFQPLDFPKEINGRQILSQHPTGREYGHLLDNCEVFPIFIDANDEILSMPPIINSNKTGKITDKTKEVFIECSGSNQESLKKTLNMILSSLADIGGKIYGMDLIDEKNNKTMSPDLFPEKMEFTLEFVNKTLGLTLNEKQIRQCLEKMGLGYEKDKDKHIALVPNYRVDILHEVDIVEEIAIAYGYENFIPEIPNISTMGEEDKTAILKRKLSELLIGLDMLELSTYLLSTKEREYKRLGYKEYKDIIEVMDSKTENNILRTSLLSQSIRILSQSGDATYPQKVFELGRVFYDDDKEDTGIGEKELLCISLCHDKANFTEIKQILDYLSRMLDFKYEIKDSVHPAFIDGRCGEVTINKKKAGFIGEISPNVLKNNKIKMPVASLEIDISTIK